MDPDLAADISRVTISRSSNSCWTCKLRRKKCDGHRPICNACTGLHIPCHQCTTRPDWMDGGVRQEQMQEDIKCKVKENAHRRRGDHPVTIFSTQNPAGERSRDSWNPVPHKFLPAQPIATQNAAPTDVDNIPPKVRHTSPGFDRCLSSSDLDRGQSYCQTNGDSPSRGASLFDKTAEGFQSTSSPESGCRRNGDIASRSKLLGRADTVHIAFYTENLFPFLFPFHHPECGKAWILELLLRSPVIRQATLCQSSYYLSLEHGAHCDRNASDLVLDQTNEAFAILSDALQIIISQGISQHLAGAVRILMSIIQLQRFEATVTNFDHRPHLSAAVALFQQLLKSENGDALHVTCARSSFNGVLNRLGPAITTLGSESVQVTSAEQTAFRFSSALAIFEDIIASTVLQETPRLYEYHNSLLVNRFDNTGPAIDLETVIGCENWAIIYLGQIAALDAWKQTCKRAGSLDVMQLVQRATTIKSGLETEMAEAHTRSSSNGQGPKCPSLPDALSSYSKSQSDQYPLVTQIWAHASMAYLFVVVSGWQPASADIRFHVRSIIDLLSQISPPALLRTMVWPFCVAGCLVEQGKETQIRGLVQALQPPSVFAGVHRALDLVEDSWRSRGSGDADRDLAVCFRRHGQEVLLA